MTTLKSSHKKAVSPLGRLLRHVRSSRGVSARQLSEMAGLSPAYISRMEAGSLEPSARALASIVKALRMSPLEAAMCLQACLGRDDEEALD